MCYDSENSIVMGYYTCQFGKKFRCLHCNKEGEEYCCDALGDPLFEIVTEEQNKVNLTYTCAATSLMDGLRKAAKSGVVVIALDLK